MTHKLDETVHGIKTPGLNNFENYVLTHNRFITYLVLIFSDLNETQLYKMPYRDSPHHEVEIILSFNHLILFKPNEHTEDYHTRKPNDENCLIEIGDRKYFYVGEKIITFETNDIIVKRSLDLGFNIIEFPYAYVERSIYFMLHQEYILIQEYGTSTIKTSMSI